MERKVLYALAVVALVIVAFYIYKRREGYCGTLSQAGYCKCTSSPVDYMNKPKDNPMYTSGDKAQPLTQGNTDFYFYSRRLAAGDMFKSLDGDYKGMNCDQDHACDLGYNCSSRY